MLVNQYGDEVFEETITFADLLSDEEAKTLLFTLIERLGLRIVRTNERGCTEIVLKGHGDE